MTLRPLPPAICGEYCVLLVGSEWKPRPTPGIVAARLANCRPLSGRLSMLVTSTTPPTDEAVVSISGVSPVTLTVSADAGDLQLDVEVDRLARR